MPKVRISLSPATVLLDLPNKGSIYISLETARELKDALIQLFDKIVTDYEKSL